VQLAGVLVVRFEASDSFFGLRGCRSQSREQRLSFVCCVPLTALAKVVESCLCGYPFLARKLSALRTVNDEAENTKELLDPAMAILQHSKWIIESTVRFRADLDRHRSFLFWLSTHFQSNASSGHRERPPILTHAPWRTCNVVAVFAITSGTT
jgi:hypothetical protein